MEFVSFVATLTGREAAAAAAAHGRGTERLRGITGGGAPTAGGRAA